MNIICCDFETYYDMKTYTLKKMTTEEYIRDPQFQVIGVAVKVNNGETDWASGTHKEIRDFLRTYDWDNAMLVCQNTAFDGFILSEIFGIHVKRYADTMLMAKAIHGFDAPASLKALAELYGVGQKGTEVISADGMRREDFTEEELSAYGDYCINDVELTHQIFDMMVRNGFPKKEMQLIDLTLKMFVRPKLVLDQRLLSEHLETIRGTKEALLAESGCTVEDLMSNMKFAELLESFGVVVPKKISPTTGKETYAFAKKDAEFLALQEHEDFKVQAIVAARLGVKSTLEETRTERLLGIAERGPIPVPLAYYAAHTGRWGGSDKINFQNFPSRGENAGKIKNAILAPEGYVLIDSDSSQIEARVLAWLAEQEDLVLAFREGRDVYKIMASAIYGKPVEEITKSERFMGKTVVLGCFGPDTNVYTDKGWKRIVEVQDTDLVWDGIEFVSHQGVVPQGEKEVWKMNGISATPDHEILTEHGWREWNEVCTNPSLFQSALRKERSLSSVMSDMYKMPEDLLDITLSYSAPVVGEVGSIDITSNLKEPLGVIHALKGRLTSLAKSIGGMKISYLISNIGRDFLIGSRRVLDDAIHRLIVATNSMAVEGSLFTLHGEPIGVHFCGTSLALVGGMTQDESWTASTTMRGTNPETYALRLDVKICSTGEPCLIFKEKLMTYDIAFAGPRNRFVVATDAGPIIVHNCGYGLGAVKFRDALKLVGVELTEDEAANIIRTYRETYPAIVGLWRRAQLVLEQMVLGTAVPFGLKGVLEIVPEKNAIRLPSGLYLPYRDLRIGKGEDGKDEYQYKSRHGWNRIYGGKVVENVCQAVARCIIGEQMILIAKRYEVTHTVHDAIACIVPEDQAEEAQAYVEECMRWVPRWATGLPVNCESGYGRSYGEC